MVDTTPAMQGRYLDVKYAKDSPSKIIQIMSEAKFKDTEFKKDEVESRLTMTVKIDGFEKIWRPNQLSVENLQAWGIDSIDWIGKKAKIQVISGMVIATPQLEVDTENQEFIVNTPK